MRIDRTGPGYADPTTITLTPDELDLVADLLYRLGQGTLDLARWTEADVADAAAMAEALTDFVVAS